MNEIRSSTCSSTRDSLDHRSDGEKSILTLGERTLRLLRQGVAAGAVVAVGANGVMGCVNDVISTTPADEVGSSRLGDYKDWAQQHGERNTAMIRFLGESWYECSYPYSRMGCAAMDIFVKLVVRPVQGADISRKHVGIVYRRDSGDGQSIARYFTTYQSGPNQGMEEWHAQVRVPVWELPGFTFDAWYQPGDGSTYYDDNEGELHAAMFKAQDAVVRVDHTVTSDAKLRVDENGIHGKIRAFVADLDPDKELELRYSTDGWQTVSSFFVSAYPDEPNAWHWVTDVSTGYDQFEIDVDLPNPPDGEPYTRFWYAIRYTHGVGSGAARRYDFWANNGGMDFHVDRPEPVPAAAPPDGE